MKRLLLPVVALAGLFAGGCANKVTMSDDLDLTFDFSLTGPDDTLHTPYVRGATMSIDVRSSDDDVDMSGWTIESSDPSIFSVGGVQVAPTGHGITAPATASGVGNATVIVRDAGGRVQDSEDVEVLLPDRAELHAYGPMLVGGDAADDRVGELRVMAGGTATFLVEYWNGARQLHGNGVLGVTADPTLHMGDEQTFLFEDREWLVISPDASLDTTISLAADGVPIGTVPVHAVGVDAVSAVQIVGQDESGKKNDTWLVAFAEAFDAAGHEIFGVQYDWTVDGAKAELAGDLYRYKFHKGWLRNLEARFNGQSAAVTIQAGEGFVDSTNNVGCRVAPGGRGVRGLVGVMTLVGLLLLADRRRDVRGGMRPN